MAQYRATGSIKHGGKWFKPGAVVEIDEKAKKSDLFVIVEQPKASKAAPVESKSEPASKSSK